MKSKITFSSEVTFVLLCGLAFSTGFLSNLVYAFDDTYLFSRFASAIDADGYWGGALDIFFGADLSSEYRTYGLSRLFHYFVYLIFGQMLFFYGLIICLSQIFTALVILKLARFYEIEGAVAVAFALTWLLVPFSLNWSFHHYTYALLPFQVLLASFYFIISRPCPHLGLIAMAGVGIGLTGELQLAAVPVAMGIAFYERRKRKQSLFPIYLLSIAFVGALMVHRLGWVLWFQNTAVAQRFSFSLVENDVFVSRFLQALPSVRRSVSSQFGVIFNSGYIAGLMVASVAILLCLYVFRLEKGSPRPRASLLKIFGLFVALSGASLVVYFALSVGTGQVFYEMPRRYGYGPLSFISIALVSAGALASVPYEKYFAVAVIFLVTGLAAQSLIVEVPQVRAVDRSIIARVSAGLAKSSKEGRGAYVFVANSKAYEIGYADGGTDGPTFRGQTEAEFSQSPFSFYWTSQGYLVHILKAAFGAMPLPDDGSPGANALARPPLSNERPEGVVIANLRLSELDPKSSESIVFDSYAQFSPNKFSRRIDRTSFGARLRGSEEFVVDLGEMVSASPGMVQDKPYEAHAFFTSNWVAQYGYLESTQSTYTNLELNAPMPYFRTNRNGAVKYQISFKQPIRIEASFDFWEQWSRGPGERVFDLDVSWDGARWARVGRIDPAALNGNKAFSVVISRASATLMQFRLVPVQGDVPMIQGIRLRRMG